ncbi:hypothetical protein C8Q74DRAFT_854155 [Fomes fomentarius]|nr:hypothetical protein C8Q74DRAFT_854155 [Fomes fomentarius]
MKSTYVYLRSAYVRQTLMRRHHLHRCSRRRQSLSQLSYVMSKSCSDPSHDQSSLSSNSCATSALSESARSESSASAYTPTLPWYGERGPLGSPYLSSCMSRNTPREVCQTQRPGGNVHCQLSFPSTMSGEQMGYIAKGRAHDIIRTFRSEGAPLRRNNVQSSSGSRRIIVFSTMSSEGSCISRLNCLVRSTKGHSALIPWRVEGKGRQGWGRESIAW